MIFIDNFNNFHYIFQVNLKNGEDDNVAFLGTIVYNEMTDETIVTDPYSIHYPPQKNSEISSIRFIRDQDWTTPELQRAIRNFKLAEQDLPFQADWLVEEFTASLRHLEGLLRDENAAI